MRITAAGFTAISPDPHSYLAPLQPDCSERASCHWVHIPSTTSSGLRWVSPCYPSCPRSSGENTPDHLRTAVFVERRPIGCELATPVHNQRDRHPDQGL